MDRKSLVKALTSDPITKKYFEGVYMGDELKNAPTLQHMHFLVANTDFSNQPGEHWFLIRFVRIGQRNVFQIVDSLRFKGNVALKEYLFLFRQQPRFGNCILQMATSIQSFMWGILFNVCTTRIKTE